MSRKRKNEISDEKLNSWLVWAISATAIVVIVISGILIFLSVGGSNKQEAMQGFYSSEVSAGNAQPASQASSKSSEEAEETEETTASSSKENTTGGATITVQAGEGEAAIAARAGISIAELEALNPGNMRTGSWYANPGDEVRVE